MKQEKYSASKSTFKFIANILSWTALALLLVIAAFLLYLAVSAKLYAAKGEKYEPKFSLYTIISPSMEPNLRVYDIIVDQRVDSVNDIKIGDVITFISTSSISANKTITHRVIDIVVDKEGNYQYKTKGDNNLSPDLAYAEYNNIIGKVIFKIPQLGRIQFFLANQGGWLIAVVIPALIIIIKDVMKIFKLAKINKKAEGIVEGTKAIDEEEKKKRQEAELTRKKHLKDKYKLKFKKYDDNTNEDAVKDTIIVDKEEPINIQEPLIKEKQEELVVVNNEVSIPDFSIDIAPNDEITNEIVAEGQYNNEITESTATDICVEVPEVETNENREEPEQEEAPIAPPVMDLELPVLKSDLPIIDEEETDISDRNEENITMDISPEESRAQEELVTNESVVTYYDTFHENGNIEPENHEDIKQTESEAEIETSDNPVNESTNDEIVEEANKASEVPEAKGESFDVYASIFNHFDNLGEEEKKVNTTEKTSKQKKEKRIR